MATADRPPVRYLAAADVLAAMPDLDERLALAERTLTALVADAELPPKIGVHPRPVGSFAHAMPAHLRGTDATGADDLLGMKWVTGFGGNNALGLPAINAVVILNDATTGLPRAILDGGPITALRTAAVSGVAIARFAPLVSGRAPRAALIGSGIQGRSHLSILGRVLAGVHLTVFDRHPDRAAALVAEAEATDGVAAAVTATDARAAVRDADVVVTTASFGPVRQVMTEDWLAPGALVVPVDYATYCSASVARGAALFLVDDRGQFLANRDAGNFDDYPDPTATLGEALLAGTPRPAEGRVVATHLGVGLADVVFGSAIVRRAEELGLGILLGLMILPKVRDPRFITVRRGGVLEDGDHHLLALWAADCAEHVLRHFEAARPDDDRPRHAIELARAWVRGEVTMTDARTSAGHANAAARDLTGAARDAAYAAAQAAAVAHVAAHELGAAAYAVRAARAASPAGKSGDGGRSECRWQRAQLPNQIRDLVIDDQRLRNELCWFAFDC